MQVPLLLGQLCRCVPGDILGLQQVPGARKTGGGRWTPSAPKRGGSHEPLGSPRHLAPPCSSTVQASPLPRMAAQCTGVHPSLSVRSSWQLRNSSSRTVSANPLYAAQCRGLCGQGGQLPELGRREGAGSSSSSSSSRGQSTGVPPRGEAATHVRPSLSTLSTSAFHRTARW